MARIKKTKTEAQKAAEALTARRMDLEAVNLPSDAATLPLQSQIEVTRAGQGRGSQTVKTDTARRLDAFEALKAGMADGAYDAARRFELDLLIRHGIADGGRSMERVDCTGGHATDAIIIAAGNVETIQDRIPPRDYFLLCELIVPPINRDGIQPRFARPDGSVERGAPLFGWRASVYYVTGESHTHGQAAAVRAAAVNLRDAYAAIERKAAA